MLACHSVDAFERPAFGVEMPEEAGRSLERERLGTKFPGQTGRGFPPLHPLPRSRRSH